MPKEKMNYRFPFCLVGLFACMIAASTATIYADVTIDTNVIDVDDPNLPDNDPTTFGLGSNLSNSTFLLVDGSSVVNLSGGNLEGINDFTDSSTFNISSGNAGSVFLSGSAALNVAGGSIGSLESMSGSTVTISAGTVDFGPSASGDIAVSGGEVNAADFFVESGDSLEISGGSTSVGNLSVSNGGTATISGGMEFDDLLFVDVSGAGSSLNLIGSDFRILFEDFDNNIFTETPVTGPITDSLTFDGISGTSLAGTLVDGTEFQISQASLSSGGVINVVAVPEPSTLGLLGVLTGLGILRRKRSGSQTSGSCSTPISLVRSHGK